VCVPVDLEKGPEEFAITNREELLSYYRLMYTMRRMEITCDNEYKVRSSSPPPHHPHSSWQHIFGEKRDIDTGH
jgi:hypothetical protein